MKQHTPKVSRRNFLFAATAGTAATAAAIVAPKAPAPGTSPEEAKTKTGGSYQLTEHVRNYYRTTRI